MARFSACFSWNYWAGICEPSGDDRISSVERLEAQMTGYSHRIRDINTHIQECERRKVVCIQKKDVAGLKLCIREKHAKQVQLSKFEKLRTFVESLHAQVNEADAVRETVQVVTQFQREFKNVNAEKLYKELAKTTDIFQQSREAVADTQQLLAETGDPAYMQSNAALEAELEEAMGLLNVPVQVDILPVPPSHSPVAARKEAKGLERSYEKFMT